MLRMRFYCVPGMTVDLEGESPSGKLIAATRVNRKVRTREGLAKRSGVTRPVGRRTETGSEAGDTRVSGQLTATLLRSTGAHVNPALVQGQPTSLTRGDLALLLNGRRRSVR